MPDALRSALSAAGAIALAFLASLQLAGACIYFFDTASLGDIGLSLDSPSSGVIVAVSPGGPADEAGIRPGDVVVSRADVAKVTWQQTIGERMTITVQRGAESRVLTLVARRIYLSLSDIGMAAICVSTLVYLVVGLFLVLTRPSRLTWGFFLSALAWWYVGPNALPVPPSLVMQYMVLWGAVIVPWSLAGYLVFCMSLPNEVPAGWRWISDVIVPAVTVLMCVFQTIQIVGPVMIGSVEFPDLWQHIWDAYIVVCCIAGFVSIRLRYQTAGNPDRQRIKWFVFGLVVTSIGAVLEAADQEGWFSTFEWVSGFAAIGIALPLAVAYAVVKHRVIDVRFVISRALVLGIVTSVVGALFFVLDSILSAHFTGSATRTAIYAACAIVIGMTLGEAYRRLGPIIDSFVFARRSRWQELSERVADAIRRSGSRAESCRPLSSGIADAFSLASVALFERTDDDGYIRVAASGWPDGSMRHIFADDTIARRTDGVVHASNSLDIDEREWHDRELPPGTGFPTVAVPIVDGKHVRALLVIGSHEDGSGLNRDELRSIRGLADAASPLFTEEAAHVGMPQGVWNRA
ncbi:MAG TPA: PDZ domain-containing protein [Candidatus Eremiobacteraceae bacterium]|jgi:hypothetical protein